MARRKTRTIGIDDLFRIRLVSGADISPDGGRIVFAVTRQDLKKNKTFSRLYSVPAAGGRLRRLTRGEHADGLPRFSPDGGTVAFLSDRDETRAVWLLPMDGGEPERLTDRDGRILDFDWAPDGRAIVVCRQALTERERLERDGKSDEAARLPHYRHVTRLFYKLDGEGFRSPERAHLHVVRVANGRSKQVTEGRFDDVSPRYSPDGDRIAFLSNRMPDPDLDIDNQDVYTVRPDGTGLRKVTRERGPAQCPVWAPDGRRIYYVGHLGGRGEWSIENVHVRRVAAGGGKSVDLTPGLDRCAMNLVIGDTAGTSFGGPPPSVSPDGAEVLFPVTDAGACRLARVPAEGGTPEVVVDGDLTVLDFGFPRAGGPGWAVVGDAGNPCDLHRLDREGGLGERLTSLNRSVLSGLDTVAPEEVRFRRKGGEVHGWVLRPPGFRKGRRYPLVLEIHGGPHVAYGHVFYHEMQLLAARGYVVLMTNPRGSDGYGREHRNAIREAWGTVDHEDLETALDGLLGRGGIDRERIYVTGGSYGGYMTNWLVGHSDRFRAAVTQRSVVNLTSFFGESDCGYYFKWELGGTPWDAKEAYERMSPLTYAEKMETPLLIVHSEEDHRCPISQAEELFVTLKLLGREVEMVRFVGESHGLSRGGRPQNRAERLRRILDWFRRHGGK